jgi:hypothetical protein
MKTKCILVAVALVAALLLLLIPRGGSQHATVKLTGPTGLSFTGAIICDGVEVEVTGSLPTNFAVSGRNVDCRFRKTEVDGELSIDIVMPDSSRGSATTSQPHGGVRAFIQRGLSEDVLGRQRFDNAAERGRCTERGRATSVSNSHATGGPRRYIDRSATSCVMSKTMRCILTMIGSTILGFIVAATFYTPTWNGYIMMPGVVVAVISAFICSVALLSCPMKPVIGKSIALVCSCPHCGSPFPVSWALFIQDSCDDVA